MHRRPNGPLSFFHPRSYTCSGCYPVGVAAGLFSPHISWSKVFTLCVGEVHICSACDPVPVAHMVFHRCSNFPDMVLVVKVQDQLSSLLLHPGHRPCATVCSSPVPLQSESAPTATSTCAQGQVTGPWLLPHRSSVAVVAGVRLLRTTYTHFPPTCVPTSTCSV